MAVYGYVRVSSKYQNEDRQMKALADCGVELKNTYIDKVSGKNFDRKMYMRMIKKIKKDDVIFIKSIDRLGRNYDEIIEQWRKITILINADIVIIDMPLLDTRVRDKDLTGKFIADLVLQILSYVAQTEREQIHQRQAEGIAAAKSRGICFGRPTKSIPKDFMTYYTLWKQNEMSAKSVSKQFKVTHHTFMKWVRLHEQEL